ncbi:malate dehydrogenase (quinone) [Staphylococcus warneri]|jgi:malate dehydrogenase (quinone)|uniref:malate dehydrogenase (quinone) n=1 Tax=Staphylococcus TaxID=1279 RepID=UPI0001A5C96A|nr:MULTISPECIES: malate dehydrogenase (quinone) [Staphylococcus]MBE9429142.1 malate dehydrogenase (quinone) [Staphylococcus epidermidis]MBY6178419.1 malate dehydrogenase (quinone) [Staphylococcaceae bacterium DP2N0-1]AXV41639.1 putative malate:quinone oxidoreductase 1 [Staphylococcus sp. M0911]EEQ78751.1 malate dehydrogenase (quinone) [Staphylococcus warneri L37603]MBO0377373.1 malate dehydrogenase (quinone) [Staphylococcus warneri]
MSTQHSKTDVILIGGGIMSATLGTLLKELTPDKEIKVFEKLNQPGEESSNVWNNAGTGHSALCELNYTKEGKDGSVDISKAIKINEQFQISKQFWAYLVRTGQLENPENFIQSVPHMSFVKGTNNIEFLKRRVESLQKNVLFGKMEISEDRNKIAEWVPLMMEGRTDDEPVAITYDETGTDVNFGALTKKLFSNLQQKNVEIQYKHEVLDIKKQSNGTWLVEVKNLTNNQVTTYETDFVFIGAGGASLPLLQKTGIKESKHIGGFPVSGLFLRCKNPDVINRHHAKVYGKAEVGAPPMSVPHLDTRFVNGERSLLFGPFAGFSPKFLKTGSYLDLIKSVKPNNIVTMLSAGVKEFDLTKYLVSQLMLSNEERVDDLRVFLPNAKDEDWEVITAGQRVQVIKDTKDAKGNLQFGTEVITSEDGTLAALLGASPGASTAVDIMFDVLQRCYKDDFKSWEPAIKEMVPSFGLNLSEHEDVYHAVNKEIVKYLKVK